VLKKILMAITTGAVNVKFRMEIFVKIPALHVCGNLVESDAVYHALSKRQ